MLKARVPILNFITNNVKISGGITEDGLSTCRMYGRG